MKNFFKLVLIVSAIFFSIYIGLFTRNKSLVPTPSKAATSISYQQDIAYGPNSKQKLDLCKPANLTNKVPGVILIHGGGGDKSQHTSQCKDLARNGFVTITVNYREDPPPTWQVVLPDNELALSWLMQYNNVDEARIGAMGGSQGGYVASMMGTKDDIDKVECVVNNFGPTDFTDPDEWGNSAFIDDSVQKFFGGVTYDEDPDLYAELSPITHVTSNDAQDWLFTRSTNDHLIPKTQMTKMMSALNNVGVKTEFYEYNGSGSGHANKLGPFKALQLYNKRINFLTNCLNGL